MPNIPKINKNRNLDLQYDDDIENTDTDDTEYNDNIDTDDPENTNDDRIYKNVKKPNFKNKSPANELIKKKRRILVFNNT